MYHAPILGSSFSDNASFQNLEDAEITTFIISLSDWKNEENVRNSLLESLNDIGGYKANFSIEIMNHHVNNFCD